MNLLSRATENVSIPNGLHNIAIAQVILFSIIYLVQLPVRYKQEWKYWHHTKRQHPVRCALYSGWSMVALLAMSKLREPSITSATRS